MTAEPGTGHPAEPASAGPVSGVNPLAPVFISYRTSDGSALAASLAWALRATGVPVWHDISDLPPGDTTRRLQEALTQGLSGAALLITPEIGRSGVVRDIEVPGLLQLEPDPDFTFAIGSIIASPPTPGSGPTACAGLDYAAADTLLAQPPGTLERFKQYPVFDDTGIAVLAREMAAQRMKAVRALGDPKLLIDIQTRFHPRGTPPQVPLAVRTMPPADGHRLPGPQIWPPFAAFLADLPRLLSIAGAERLRIRGGAHLTIAFALGAAVPATSRWPVTVEDQAGALWGLPGSDNTGARIRLRENSEPDSASTATAPAAIYVDLVPDQPPGDAFARHIAGHSGQYARITRLQPARRQVIPPQASASLVHDLAHRIRNSAAQAGTHRVHLFLRVPFPVAVLLGRTLNTLRTTLYEWDDTTAEPRYVQTITVTPGRGGGPIIADDADERAR
jgi:SMODS-associated and fused to various effectors sensor domain/TIR domain